MAKIKLPKPAKYCVETLNEDGTTNSVHYEGNDKAAATTAFEENPQSQVFKKQPAIGFHRK